MRMPLKNALSILFYIFVKNYHFFFLKQHFPETLREMDEACIIALALLKQRKGTFLSIR